MEKYSYLADATKLFGEKWQKEMLEEVHKKFEENARTDEINELKAKNHYLSEQVELAKKLEIENEELRANLREASEQCRILRAQLDMVYLIFGKR